MRRVNLLKSLPVLLLGAVLALLPSASAAAGDVYGEVAVYRWDAQNAKQLAISGDLIAVGRAANLTDGLPAAVTVMRIDTAGAVLDSQTLTAPEGINGFGVGLALDEESGRLYVGASATGSNVVYEYLLTTDGGAWRWDAGREFRPPVPIGAGAQFGESLSLRGDKLAIGALFADNDNGAVFVVDLPTGNIQRAGVTGLTAVLLGDEVRLTDHLLIAGAHAKKVSNPAGGTMQVGGVYVWDLDDLSAPKKLIEHPALPDPAVYKTGIFPGPGMSGGFGYDIAVTDTDLFIGTPDETNYTADDPNDPLGGWNNSSIDEGTTTNGAVYRFSLSDLQQVGPKIIPTPHFRNTAWNIAAEGNALLVGSSTNDDGQVGQVLVYDIATLAVTSAPGDLMRQQPVPDQILQGSDTIPGDRFAGACSLRAFGSMVVARSFSAREAAELPTVAPTSSPRSCRISRSGR